MMGSVVLSHCDLWPTSHCSLKSADCHRRRRQPRQAEWVEVKQEG